MTKTANWTTLILICVCVLAAGAIVPAAVAAQGAESEYDLDLPGSGGDESTPAATSQPSSTGDSEESGFPVVVLGFAVVGGLAVGLALWRMKTSPGPPDEPGAAGGG